MINDEQTNLVPFVCRGVTGSMNWSGFLGGDGGFKTQNYDEKANQSGIIYIRVWSSLRTPGTPRDHHHRLHVFLTYGPNFLSCFGDFFLEILTKKDEMVVTPFPPILDVSLHADKYKYIDTHRHKYTC